jgi:hypothetical protein
MGGWPRGHRTSADNKEIGFPRPFFTPRHETAPRRQEMGRRRQPASAARNPATVIRSSPSPAAAAIKPDRGRLPGREAISVWAATCPGRWDAARQEARDGQPGTCLPAGSRCADVPRRYPPGEPGCRAGRQPAVTAYGKRDWCARSRHSGRPRFPAARRIARPDRRTRTAVTTASQPFPAAAMPSCPVGSARFTWCDSGP